jgi:hypothetical protein
MPALKIFEGEAPDPQRGPGEGLLFDRLPCSARKDPRIGKGAKLLLAAIVPRGGPWPQWVERTDGWLSDETGQSTTAIGRNMKELETAGWIQRVRRRNHRKIYLLFDLAGRMQSSRMINALIAGEQCTDHLRSMHSSPVSSPSIRGREIKILRQEGGSPSATSPSEGGSPTTTPTTSEKKDIPAHKQPATPNFLEVKADPETLAHWRNVLETHGPNSPLGRIARKILDAPVNQE